MSLMTFLNTKAKALVVYLFSLSALGLMIPAAFVGVWVCDEWHGLAVGVVLMILAIPFHMKGKTHPTGYIISFLINAVGTGFSASAYYSSVGQPLSLYHMMFGLLPAAAVLTLVYAMLQVFSKTKKITVTVAVVMNVVLLIAAVVFWIQEGAVLYSFAFFALLVALFYLGTFAVTINHDERAVLRDISFGGFGSFVILSVVVAVILSDGEVLEGAFDGLADAVTSGGDKTSKTK